jgi:hypothetical protein
VSFFRNLIDTLRRLLVPAPRSVAFFAPKPFGPGHRYRDETSIVLDEGEFAGQEFHLTHEISEDEAHVHLSYRGREIGHCDIQRNAHEASIVLWNIVVQEQLRHKGFASLMTYAGFRKMLELHKNAVFAVRMIRLIKPSEKITRIQNVGIGIIARKLGFSPEYDLQALLREQNIQVIELISSDGVMPPGYRIVLKSYPLVLIAFLVDPDTNKPYPSQHRIYNSLVTAESAEVWAKEGRIIIGNGNYLLRRHGIETLINHLATNETEAAIYAQRIRPVTAR